MNLDELWGLDSKTVYEKPKQIFVPLLEKAIEEGGNREFEPIDEPVFRASGLGNCGRYILYTMQGYKEERSAREILTLDIGTLVHEALQKYIKDGKGYKLISLEEKVETPLIQRTTGHYDGLLEIDGKRYLLEIKTSNVEAFQRLVDRPVPYAKHKKQATFYMSALNVDETIFIYVNKNGMFVGDFAKTHPEANPVFLEIRYKFENSLIDENVDFVDDLTNHFFSGTMPPYKKHSMCDYCPKTIKEKCKADRKIERKLAKEKS